MCCVCALHSPCSRGLGWHGDAVKVRIFLHLYWGKKKAVSASSDLYCRQTIKGLQSRSAQRLHEAVAFPAGTDRQRVWPWVHSLTCEAPWRPDIRPHRTAPPPSGRTRFEILISSTLTKLMCRDGCNYKHNMECNHPIMIGDTWESAVNRVCSSSSPPSPPSPCLKPCLDGSFRQRCSHLVGTRQIKKNWTPDNINDAAECQMSWGEISSAVPPRDKVTS